MRGIPLWASALGVTSLMQATSAFLTGVLPVIGPTLTRAAGVAPERVGYLAALGSLGTMLFLVTGNALLARLGPVRLLQLGMLVGAGALAIALTGAWPALLLAALLVGVGYGPSPPAGSDILFRHAPAKRRSLVFSIKQAAVPMGGAFNGLMVPGLATHYGWRTALICAALLGLTTILVVQPWRAIIDADRDPRRKLPLAAFLSPASLAAPFRALATTPDLSRFSYVGFAFAVVQGCILGFYVTLLVTQLGYSLAAAGLAFAVLQGTGVAARIGVGWIADRIGSAARTLGTLAIGSTGAALAAAAITPAWPWWAILLAAVATGFAATSWNGVYLAEVARLAPPGRVGDATAGSTFLAFTGYVIGPAGIATVVEATGSYRLAFAMIAILPLSAALLLRTRTRSPPRG